MSVFWLDSEAQAEVRVVLARTRPPSRPNSSPGARDWGIRGYGSDAVRIAMAGRVLAPGDTRRVARNLPLAQSGGRRERRRNRVDALLLRRSCARRAC